MNSQILMIGARGQLCLSIHRRVFSHQARAIHFTVLLICTLYCLVASGPCEKQSLVEFGACESYRDNDNAGLQDVSSSSLSKSQLADLSLENICSNSNLFCFPSTLPGFLPVHHSPESTELEASSVQSDATLPVGSTQDRNNLSWSSDYGMFKLLSGQAVSCFLHSQEVIHDISSLQTNRDNQNYASSCGGCLSNQKTPSSNMNKNSEKIKSGSLEGFLSPHVKINPPLLDWGEKYLSIASLASVSVTNTHNESMLYMYEPFSTNAQFYPCNFSEVFLGPGEVASICFVFLPTWLGMSSAHLIFQTSSGGFLIQAKGFAVESPYGSRPFIGLGISSSGRWSKTLSLFNPFDETLYVEEVTAWISVTVGNASDLTTAICRIENFQVSDEPSDMNVKERLDVRSGQVGLQIIAMRPHKNWDVSPGSTETIIEIDFSYNSAGKVFGAVCMQLLRSSQGKSDTIVVPLDVDLGGESVDNLPDYVSISFVSLVPCGSGGTAVALLLRNRASHVLNVNKISLVGEGMRHFRVKYSEGLLLFPGSMTQVAVITYFPLPTGLHDSSSVNPNMDLSCKLVIQTNDSINPQIEVLCKDIVNTCLNLDFNAKLEQHDGKTVYGSARSGPLGGSMQSQSQIMAMESAELDELVLENWKSQGTANGMSVLDNHEVLFPVVQVGTHHSKWITVRNPSQEPVVMQLIMNSGEIIDECSTADWLSQPSSSVLSSGHTASTGYGFSLADSALTEAYVHPYETASLGPIDFHPSSRCAWTSSALIRNNLSGVEWLSLRGYGGSFSLVLFEMSTPVQSLEFKFNMPSPLNFSPDILFQMEDTTYTCLQPLSKELYAKNMGDLPLHVKRIEVSGTECELDGFVVHTCKGFALEPGESMKLLISYQADFSAVMVQRDLELALRSGILVIPMKASLPLHMLNLCKKSMFWMRLKKLSFAILLVAFLMFLLFFFILPQLMASGSQDYIFKSGKNSTTSVRHVGKSSRVHRNQKNSNKFVMSSETNGFLRSIREEETLMLESVKKYPDGKGIDSEQGISAQHAKPVVQNEIKANYLLGSQKKITLESCALREPSTVENSDGREASKDGKLTVRIGKEKGRRRRKKKGSGSGLTGIFEVSSSQSGNSTPSSPLSPVTSFTPKRLWSVSSDADQSVDASTQCAHVAKQRGKISGTEPVSEADMVKTRVSMKYSNKNCFALTHEKPSAPREMAARPALLPSATFPGTNRSASESLCPSPSFLSPTSKIAAHARAPGFKPYSQKTVKPEEKTRLEDQFKYDIWGDHLFGLHLMGRPKEVSAMTSSVTENQSESFFVRGPQALMSTSQPKAVSCYQEG